MAVIGREPIHRRVRRDKTEENSSFSASSAVIALMFATSARVVEQDYLGFLFETVSDASSTVEERRF
jgi:hypothetical protein